MTDDNFTTFKLLSIDAWRDPDGGWTWNNAYTLEEGIVFHHSRLTPRKILAALRRWGYLTNESKGRCRVDDAGTAGDLYEIQDRATGEPLLALSTIH
jgi:hypothetical protein